MNDLWIDFCTALLVVIYGACSPYLSSSSLYFYIRQIFAYVMSSLADVDSQHPDGIDNRCD